ncbi:transglycosylase SLT domain-containing protein [Pseudoxanthomonas sp. LjRoot168]|uniref:lytic transglycosylase domain-containing protein n=2 Tax=unclassified Pseudoxanthomonas TaxID=2645906 RepID=UPI003ECEE0AA
MDAMAVEVVQQQAQCIRSAASAYGVAEDVVVREVSLRAGGRGRIVQLADGNFEVGVMRIPGAALPALGQYGISQQQLVADDCLSIQVGTYMIRLRELEQAKQALYVASTQRGSSNVRQCVAAASQRYRVPEVIIMAYLKTEGGSTGKQNRNTNASYDMGLMQVNDIHLRGAPHYLERHGITRERLMNDACLNIHVGTYLAAYEISKAPNFWTGVGNYHSKTPPKREAYMRKFYRNLASVSGGAPR